MIRYNGKEVIPKYNGSNCVKMIQNGVTLWEEVVKSYIVNASTVYSGNSYKCTINGTSVSCVDNKDKDLSSYAPIITFKIASIDGIRQLPYLGDCEELTVETSNYTYKTHVPDINTKKCKKITMKYISSAAGVDFDSVTSLSLSYGSGTYDPAYSYINIRNLGKSSLATYNLQGAKSWNSSSYKQYLIDSLITNSYDRAANGMSAATIRLYSSVLSSLSAEQKAQITAKGFTLTSA